MSLISKVIKVAVTSIGLTASFDPAFASSGLVVKLLDGSVPINQPDLFANAYSKAWGNGTQFCAALRTLLAPLDSNYPTVSACTAAPFGNTGVVKSGDYSATIDFTAVVTLKGTAPFYDKTCGFTDTINVQSQVPLTLSTPVMGPTPPTIALAPSNVIGKLAGETWDEPCSNSSGNHPAGISGNAVIDVQTAASNVNFPGAALIDALAPYQASVGRDLISMVYQLSTQTGDVTIDVVNSFLHQKLDSPPLATATGTFNSSTFNTSKNSSQMPATSTVSVAPSAWGAQSTQPAGTPSTAPNWGTATSPVAPGSGSVLNRSVGSALQAKPIQGSAAQSPLKQ